MKIEDELKQEAGKWLKDNIRTEKKDGMTFNIVPTPVQIYCAGAEPREKQLIKAKEIIKKFSEFVNNEIEYDPENPQEHTDLWNKLCEEAEQFLKETR